MPQLILDSFIVSSFHTVVLFFKTFTHCSPNTQQCPMGKVTQTHHCCLCKKQLRELEIYIVWTVMNSCGVLVVLSSTSTRKPGSHQHSLNTLSACLIAFSDWEESNCHHCTYSDARFDDWCKPTCAQLTAHTNTPYRHSLQPAMRKAVRWSLVFLRGRKSGELNVPFHPPTPTGHSWWMDW